WSDLGGGVNLFDSVVVFENYPIGGAADTGMPSVLEVEGVDTTSFPLSLSAYLDERLCFDLDYDPRLFDAATIERLAGHLEVLLTGIGAAQGSTLAELTLLNEDERQRVLVEWNNTHLDVPDVTLPEVFQAQVQRTPEASALVFGDTALNYAELNFQANRLARHLVGVGVGPERVVAVALPRSAELVVTILAVFKAGGIYLPVDPELPVDRIEFLLRDAAPVVVVTTNSVKNVHAALTEDMACVALGTTEIAETLAGCPDSDLTDADRLGPLRTRNTAYVIYTSGSTGTPKGVMVEHGNVVNLLVNHRNGFVAAAGGERLRVALSAVFSFHTSKE
ncbi:MAG: AMP-binding protein, partial [Pseudonocardiaceae bacterium]